MKYFIGQLIQYMDWLLLKVYFFALGAGLVIISVEFYLRNPSKYLVSVLLLLIGLIFSIISLWGTYFYEKFIRPYDPIKIDF